MKKYRCIKSFSVDTYDEDGFLIPNKEKVVEVGSVYNLDESGSTIIGGEIHIDNYDDSSWLELSKESFEELFEEVRI